MKEYQQIIKEICDDLNIKITLLSKDFIIKLEKNNQIEYIFGYKFPLNNHGLGLVLDDKYATYEILKNLNFKVCEIVPIFNNYNQQELLNYLKKYREVIIKSNNGTCGSEVFKVNNRDDLFDKVNLLLIKNQPVCMSPYYRIKNEYRVIVLNKEIKVLYGKKRPIIIGNGIKTIKDLLLDFNYNYYSKDEHLKELNLNLEEVLNKDLKLEIGFKFNLSKGSNIFSLENQELEEKIEKMALDITNSLNIEFASIDIVELENNDLMVLEINSGVMMDNYIKLNKDGYSIAKNIYLEAIKTMFNK